MLACLVAVASAVVSGAAIAAETWSPPDDTITRVSGTPRSGLHVVYVGRPDAYLPTMSEAIAECGEYDRMVRRIRCRVQVRTWYHDLADTRRAIRYARADQH